MPLLNYYRIDVSPTNVCLASILDPVTRIVSCDIELMVDSPSTIRVAKAQLTRQPLQSRYLSVSIWSRWQEMSGFVNSVTQARRPDRLSHRFPHPHLAVCQLFCENQTIFTLKTQRHIQRSKGVTATEATTF